VTSPTEAGERCFESPVTYIACNDIRDWSSRCDEQHNEEGKESEVERGELHLGG
jgi:hypothetical protein